MNRLNKDIHSNEDSLARLIWEIKNSQNQFKLILAACNYPDLRQKIVGNLRETCSVSIGQIALDANTERLYYAIEKQLGKQQPAALMVFGFETIAKLENLLISANQIREEFRENFHFPLILWVNDRILNQFQVAPDFKNWGTYILFKKTTSELLKYLRKKAEDLFEEVLNTGSDCFLSTETFFNESDRRELESVLRDLGDDSKKLAPDLQACLEFIQGRDAYSRDEINWALAHYQRSFAFWHNGGKAPEQYPDLTDIAPDLRKGVIFSNIGLCHYRNAELERAAATKHWKKARHYFAKCIQVFEQSSRQDLVAKFISQLGNVVQKLQQWDELEEITQTSLQLHQTTDDMAVYLAQDYGFMAEVALHRQRWHQAQTLTEQALQTLEQVSDRGKWQSYRSWSLLLRSQSLCQLDRVGQATQTLEQAAAVELEDDPQLYIDILERLRSLYLQQRQYHLAFKTKQKLRSFEYQYGFRAFVGAGHLRPQKPQTQVREVPLIIGKGDCPSLQTTQDIQESQWKESVEHLIETSGRQESVNELINRASDTQHKLTVIHGQSGVGKSSLIHAALVPALKHETVRGREFLPVVLEVYSNWVEQLGQILAKALEEKGIPLATPLNSTTDLVEILRRNETFHLQTVLIFDPFENLFFTQKQLDRQTDLPAFFNFLRQCLNLSFIKIILSIREDYLHYLLSASRQIDLGAINNDILSKDVLYYLANFSPDNAYSVIESLTRRSQLNLEDRLIVKLVEDLTELQPQSEVRPVELQIVGAAIQDARIRTLEDYQNLGSDPKTKLVEKYLEAVFEDCGTENRSLILKVLKYLVDPRGYRPLRTRSQFESTLNVPADRLKLILEILQGNNLIFRFRNETEDQYQLVHDYLVEPIQQKIKAEQGIAAEITLLEKVIYNFRTPLTAIVGYSEMLSESDSDDRPEIQDIDVLKKITRIGRMMLQDMSDIRDLFKLESGTIDLFIEELSIHLIVENVIDILKEYDQKLPLKILTDLEIAGTIHADVTRLRQCLTNVFSNAIYLARPRPVTLAVDRHFYNGCEWITFQINLPALNLTHLQIQQLFQATTYDTSLEESISPENKMSQQLTIAQKLCHRMGGGLKLEDRFEEGATFVMELPALCHEPK